MENNLLMENELIANYKLKHYLNTTIYENNEYIILSPYVGNKYNWFDLREVNLARCRLSSKKQLLIIRHKSFGFLSCELPDFISKMINDEFCVVTSHSGKHWKFHININEFDYYVVNHNRNTIIYKLQKLTLGGSSV